MKGLGQKLTILLVALAAYIAGHTTSKIKLGSGNLESSVNHDVRVLNNTSHQVALEFLLSTSETSVSKLITAGYLYHYERNEKAEQVANTLLNFDLSGEHRALAFNLKGLILSARGEKAEAVSYLKTAYDLTTINKDMFFMQYKSLTPNGVDEIIEKYSGKMLSDDLNLVFFEVVGNHHIYKCEFREAYMAFSQIRENGDMSTSNKHILMAYALICLDEREDAAAHLELAICTGALYKASKELFQDFLAGKPLHSKFEGDSYQQNIIKWLTERI